MSRKIEKFNFEIILNMLDKIRKMIYSRGMDDKAKPLVFFGRL